MSEKITGKGPLVDILKLENYLPDQIRTGFGTSNLGVPYRVMAYAMPLIQVAEYYQVVPSAYTATLFASQLGIGNVSQNATLMRDFIDHACNKLDWPQIIWIKEKNTIPNSTQSFLNDAASYLMTNGSDGVKGFLGNRNGYASAQYAAAHATYMALPLRYFDEYPDTSLLEGTPPNHLLMVGGPAEKMFLEVQETLWCREANGRLYGDGIKRQQRITLHDIGRRPPYVRYMSEPVVGDRMPGSLSDALELYNNEIQSDFLNWLIGMSISTPFRIENDQGQWVSTAKLVQRGKASQQVINDLVQSYDRWCEICAKFPRHNHIFVSTPT